MLNLVFQNSCFRPHRGGGVVIKCKNPKILDGMQVVYHVKVHHVQTFNYDKVGMSYIPSKRNPQQLQVQWEPPN